MPDDADYDRSHWETVIGTVIDRIGVEELMEIIVSIDRARAADADHFRRFLADNGIHSSPDD